MKYAHVLCLSLSFLILLRLSAVAWLYPIHRQSVVYETFHSIGFICLQWTGFFLLHRERERFVLFSKGCFCFIQSDAERHFHLVSFFFVIFPFLCGRMNFQAPVEIGFTPTLVFFFLLSFSFFFFHISNSLTPFYSLCHREMRRFVLSLPSSARPMGKSYWTGNRWALIFCEISSRIHLCYTSSL